MAFPKPNKGGGDFENAPEGNHVARCYQMVDLGIQETTYKGEAKLTHQVRLGFELCDELMKDGRPFSIGNTYTYSLGKKANLRKILEGWRGKTFTDEEIDAFELPSVLGAPCLVNVGHTHKDGNTYVNIINISKLPKGMEAPPLANPKVLFSPEDWDDAVFEKLPEWLRKKINARVQETPDPTRGEAGFEDLHDLGDDDIPF